MKQPTLEDVYDMLKLVLKKQSRLEAKLSQKEKIPYEISEEEVTKLRYKMHKRKSA